MRTPNNQFLRSSVLLGGLIFVVCFASLAKPSKSEIQSEVVPRAALLAVMVREVHALPAAPTPMPVMQDAGQATPPPAASSAPKPVELPEGDGKPIATEFCQDCHRLTNLTKAHKDLDDWKDTLHTMIDRGSRLPDDKIDTLAKYLVINFGPKDSAAGSNGQAAAPSTPATSPDAAAPSTPAPAQAVVVLPDGDGKAIATENCQACHKLTNLTKAHKSLDEWKDTVQTMIDRGANVPADKVDILVQYLAKNFGPKDASTPAAPAASAPAN